MKIISDESIHRLTANIKDVEKLLSDIVISLNYAMKTDSEPGFIDSMELLNIAQENLIKVDRYIHKELNIHVVIRSEGERHLSVEIANPWGGGGNREIYSAAKKLKEAIDKHGFDK